MNFAVVKKTAYDFPHRESCQEVYYGPVAELAGDAARTSPSDLVLFQLFPETAPEDEMVKHIRKKSNFIECFGNEPVIIRCFSRLIYYKYFASKKVGYKISLHQRHLKLNHLPLKIYVNII